MKTPEGYEKDEICKFLDSLELECWYFRPTMGGYGKSGVSDIIGSYRGRFFGIEVKREGKGPTVLQQRRMADIRTSGGTAFAGTASIVIPLFRKFFGL